MNRLRVQDVDYAFVDRGAGDIVLLVHGFPVDHSMWTAQIAELSTAYRVIAPDLRGFGRTPLAASDAEADRRAAQGVTMEEYAEDLARLLDGLGVSEPIALAGFSMGGYAAWQFWRKFPERLRSLVLCDTRAVADTDEGRNGRLDMAEHVCQWGSGRVAELMLPKLFAASTIAERPGVVEPVRQVIAATDPRSIAAAQRGMAARADVTGWLGQIMVPSLFLVGEHDEISRAGEMRSMSESVPRGQFIVVPNAGHMAPVENPGAVTSAIADFLPQS